MALLGPVSANLLDVQVYEEARLTSLICAKKLQDCVNKQRPVLGPFGRPRRAGQLMGWARPILARAWFGDLVSCLSLKSTEALL